MDVKRLGLIAMVVLVAGLGLMWLLLPRPRLTATATLITPTDYHAKIETNIYAEDPTVRCEVGDGTMGTDSFMGTIDGDGETVTWLGVLAGGDGGRRGDEVPITCSILR